MQLGNGNLKLSYFLVPDDSNKVFGGKTVETHFLLFCVF